MKATLGTIFVSLVGLSVIAWWWRPPAADDGREPLVWVTGFNTERQAQADLFLKSQEAHRAVIDPNNTGNQKIIVQISSGIGPDLFDVYNPASMETLVAAGVVKNLAPEFSDSAFGFERKTYAASRDWLQSEDGIWGYPSNVNADILFYNKDVFDERGLSYPEKLITWKEFFAIAEKLRRDSPQQSERVVPVARLRWITFFASMRGQYFSEDGTRLLLTGPKMIEAIKMHRDAIFRDGIMLPSLEVASLSAQAGAGGQSSDFTLFLDGFYGMMTVGKWALIDMRMDYAYRQELRQRGEAVSLPRIGVAMVPRFEGLPPSYLVKGRAAAVSTEADNTDGALAFLRFLSGEAYSRAINAGRDALPPNPEFAWAGVEEGYEELSEREAHALSIESVEKGYVPHFSPFLLHVDVERVVEQMISRLEADPDLDIMALMERAETSLYRVMARNIRRDPKLKKLYLELTGYESPQARDAAERAEGGAL